MKKMVIMLTIFTTTLMGATVYGQANKNNNIRQENCNVINVVYDDIEKSYNMYMVDNNGEGWYYELLKTNKKKNRILEGLKKAYVGQNIKVTYDNNDTPSNIYDDSIIDIELIIK